MRDKVVAIISGGSEGEPLRSYAGPWKGQLLLVCGKCRRKLRRGHGNPALRKLKKTLKHRAKQAEDGLRLRIIETPCLKMCPKGGVTVCTQAQIGRGQCSILRDAADVEALYSMAKSEATSRRQIESFSQRPAQRQSGGG